LVPQARAALRAAKKLSFVDSRRLAVFGFSMGGWTALNLAALEPKLKAVVAVAPCGGPEMIGPGNRAFLTHLSKPLNAPAPAALEADFRRAMRRFDPALAIPRLRAPLLLVHGDQDQTIPAAISKRYAAIAGKRGRLVVLRGADHGFLDAREKLTRLASDFLSSRV
jgi:dipeptidyl aminopeptidase/acylaminoacyl peptidase